MKRTLETQKTAVYHSAGCHEPGCKFFAESTGNGSAQAKARDHARRTGHAVSCDTTVGLTYNPKAMVD